MCLLYINAHAEANTFILYTCMRAHTMTQLYTSTLAVYLHTVKQPDINSTPYTAVVPDFLVVGIGELE